MGGTKQGSVGTLLHSFLWIDDFVNATKVRCLSSAVGKQLSNLWLIVENGHYDDDDNDILVNYNMSRRPILLPHHVKKVDHVTIPCKEGRSCYHTMQRRQILLPHHVKKVDHVTIPCKEGRSCSVPQLLMLHVTGRKKSGKKEQRERRNVGHRGHRGHRGHAESWISCLRTRIWEQITSGWTPTVPMFQIVAIYQRTRYTNKIILGNI